MIFKREVTLISPLTNDEIVNKLKRITTRNLSSHSYSYLNKYKFTGNIKGNSFLIYPINVDRPHLDGPEIQGYLENDLSNGSLVKLKVQLNIQQISLLVVVLVINLGFIDTSILILLTNTLPGRYFQQDLLYFY